MPEPVVTIKQGHIKGTTDTNLDGGQFYKFLGIPYAKPPVGSLRFKPSQPVEKWNEIRDCTKEGSGCLCYYNETQNIVGSEDCLYLNVFTKELPETISSPKPVMVFIHGGGFTVGSSSEGMHGPKNLLTEDIVLVTFNYRLGIFGFLSSDDLSLEASGNAGLKDQTFALKWVQENIASFNGDPNNVTLFGISAGAAAVTFQILSSTAKGLFHKAIAQSGSAFIPWAWGQKNAIQVAEILGNKVVTDKEALNVLMKTPAEELLTAALKIPDYVINTSRRRPFGPVIEKPNPTAFITENPKDLMASGKFNQVPLIQGIVSNEGLIYEVDTGSEKEATAENEVFWSLGLEEGTEERKKFEKSIDDFYFKGEITKDKIYKLIGDINFLVGTVELTRLAYKTSKHPVYLYLYSRECGLSDIMKKVHKIDPNIKGVSHGGDQMVIFSHQLRRFLGIEMTEDNIDAAKQIVKLWADFAKTGKPHPDWEPVTDPDNLKFFEINENLKLQFNPFAERCAFWDKLLKDKSCSMERCETTKS